MSNSKKTKVLRRLRELKNDIDEMQSLAEFHGWLSEMLSITNTYFKSKEIYNKLSELNEHADGDSRYIDSRILQPNLKDKAVELTKVCIRIIESEGISIEKKTIIESIFNSNTLLTILITTLFVGIPAVFGSGWWFSNTIHTKQQEIDNLRLKVDSLNQKTVILRDSIRLLSQ